MGIGLGLVAMVIATGATFVKGSPEKSFETRGGIHKCTFPIIELTGQSDCTAEAASYATAVVNLQAAQAAADAAYSGWYNCYYGGDPGIPGDPGDPEPEHTSEIAPPSYSVLER